MATTLNQLITASRKAKGLTQEQVAEETKLTLRTIQRLENQETQPRLHTLKAVAVVLDIPWERIQALLVDNKPTAADELPAQEQRRHVQLINLASLAGLFLPFFNILLPYMLIRRSDRDDVQSWQLLVKQIWWTVWTQGILLLTVGYNHIVASRGNIVLLIPYLLPVLVMYALNGLHIYRTHQRLQVDLCNA